MPKAKPLPSAREVVARNLRLIRRAKSLSQENVALEAGISRPYVSSVERSAINASLDQLEMIAKAVGVPLHDLTNPKLFPDLDGS